MHGSIIERLLILFVFLVILHRVSTECLYPTWEVTCQQYCLSQELYDIQTNQCWSEDPSKLRCICNHQDFTEEIKAIFMTQNDKNPTSK